MYSSSLKSLSDRKLIAELHLVRDAGIAGLVACCEEEMSARCLNEFTGR